MRIGANTPPRPAPEPIETRRDPRVRALAGAGLGVGFGALPGVHALLQARAGAFGARWRALVLASYRAPTPIAADVPDAGGRFSLWTLGAAGCGRFAPVTRLDVAVCGGFELGQITGRGYGLSSNGSARLLWTAPLVELALQGALGPRQRVALGLLAQLAVPLQRHAFEIADLGDLYTLGPLQARVLFTVEFRVPGLRPASRAAD